MTGQRLSPITRPAHGKVAVVNGLPAPTLQLMGAARLHQALPPGEQPQDATSQPDGLATDLPDTATGYLLAVLGTRSDWVAREELAALFWPEAAPEDAQRNLRVNLNRLRDRLHEWGVADALASERRRLRWLPGSDVVRARAARAAGDWPATAALCSGAFAPSLGFRGYPVLAEWAEGERRALQALAREAVLRCAAVLPPAQAAELAGRQLAVEPGDEELLRVLLQALAALGRHDEVAQAFQAFDARMRADHGLPASTALTQWAARLGPAASGPGTVQAVARDATLVGRDEDQTRLQSALARHRLVTLVGLGGVGKTRLARAVADAAPTALWLPLLDVLSVSEVPHRVQRALGLPPTPQRDPAASAGELLAQRGVGLLVLDNAEHLLSPDGAICRLLSGWLAIAPALRLLVTSREPLGGAAEVVLPLRALALPAPGSQDLAAPAVQLLAAQARHAQPGFDARAHREALVGITRAVGGLPLALHLCAQWLRLLSPADVLAALQRGVGELDDRATGIGPTLQGSWQRLDGAAQQALAALSVFVSPFTAEDAVQAGAATLPVLARLTDLGLVESTPAASAGHATQFGLHPLVRAFAAERLAAQPVAQRAAQERHAQAVRRRLAPWQNWRAVDQRLALASLVAMLPAVLAAWSWALAQGRSDFVAEVAPVLVKHYEKLGRWAEGIALFEAAEPVFDEQAGSDCAALAALWRGRALLLYRDGRFEAAAALARRALAAARTLGHGEGIKANLNTLALSNWMLGHLDAAQAEATEARDLARSDGDQAGVAVFAGNLALLHKKRGHYADALASWQEALAVHREVGNWSSACVTMNNLGNLLRVMGRPEEAVLVLAESLRLCDAYGFASTRPFALVNLAQAHMLAGRADTAETLALQTVAEVRRSGERMLEAGTLLVLADIALRNGNVPLAAERLAPALRLAHALNEPANLLEALCGYARWQLARGLPGDAARAVATVLAHPKLHAELREEIQTSALATLPGGPAADVLALVEEACAQLAAKAQHLQSPANTFNTPV
jgi:predicted ATPase/DNA-binding SARP family transcriptional activator